MTRLRHCSTEVIGSIKKMFTCLIKDAFKYRFKFQCPKYLCRVRDLSFLPHLLQCQMSWHEVTLSQLTFALEIPPNDLDMVLMQPSGLQPEEGTHPVGSRLLSYRLDNNGALPTRMKSFYSWNLSSWTSTAAQDYRLRRCRCLLKRGPICLQETKWKGSEPEAIYQGLPRGQDCPHTCGCLQRTCQYRWSGDFVPSWLADAASQKSSSQRQSTRKGKGHCKSKGNSQEQSQEGPEEATSQGQVKTHSQRLQFCRWLGLSPMQGEFQWLQCLQEPIV